MASQPRESCSSCSSGDNVDTQAQTPFAPILLRSSPQCIINDFAINMEVHATYFFKRGNQIDQLAIGCEDENSNCSRHWQVQFSRDVAGLFVISKQEIRLQFE